MEWITLPLIAIAAAAVGTIAAARRRKPKKSASSIRAARKLVKINPASASVEIVDDLAGASRRTPIGTASFLRCHSEMYREKQQFYITTPDKLKSSGQSQLKADSEVVLRFMHRGVPHAIACRALGRTKLHADVAAKLDQPAKVALKLSPVSRVRKAEQRSFLRYTAIAGQDESAGSNPYISFDVFVRRTDRPVSEAGDTKTLMDLTVAEFKPSGPSRFDVGRAINQFMAYMLMMRPLWS